MEHFKYYHIGFFFLLNIPSGLYAFLATKLMGDFGNVQFFVVVVVVVSLARPLTIDNQQDIKTKDISHYQRPYNVQF